jgi:hypothetical protein
VKSLASSKTPENHPILSNSSEINSLPENAPLKSAFLRPEITLVLHSHLIVIVFVRFVFFLTLSELRGCGTPPVRPKQRAPENATKRRTWPHESEASFAARALGLGEVMGIFHVTSPIETDCRSLPSPLCHRPLDVCESYSADIRAGRHRPHPWHWQALAKLVGL